MQCRRLPLNSEGVPRAAGAGTASTRSLALHAGSGLLNYLVATWDDVRRYHEPSRGAGSNKGGSENLVDSAMEISARYVAYTLEQNKFCFNKGASHRSNHIYLVVDREQFCFRQKCHDADCRYFASNSFPVPPWLVDTDAASDCQSHHMEIHAAHRIAHPHSGSAPGLLQH